MPDRRYFVDIYANAHGSKGKAVEKIDYQQRREPLRTPRQVEASYKPVVDYEPIVAAMDEPKEH